MEEIRDLLGQILMCTDAIQQQQEDFVKKQGANDNKEVADINITVSGNSMSLLSMVVKNPQVSNSLKNVASSFQVLNQQLERYEKTFSHLKGLGGFGRGYGQIQSIVHMFEVLSDPKFIKNIKKADKVFKNEKIARSIGKFFSAMAEELKHLDKQKIGSLNSLAKLGNFLAMVTAPDFLKNLKEANKWFGSKKKGLLGKIGIGRTYEWMINPHVIPRWFNEFTWAINDSDVKIKNESIKNLQKIANFLQIVTEANFIKNLKLATKLYGFKNENSLKGLFLGKKQDGNFKINPTVIPLWFGTFSNSIKDNVILDRNFKDRMAQLKNIHEFIEWAANLKMIAQLKTAEKMYKGMTSDKIVNFYKNFIDNLQDLFKGRGEKTLSDLGKRIHSLQSIVEDLMGVTKKIYLLGLIGLFSFTAIPGLWVINLSLRFGLFPLLNMISQRMALNAVYTKSLLELTKSILLLSLSLIAITAAMLLAERIGWGALKIVFPLLAMVVIFGIVLLINKLMFSKALGLGNPVQEGLIKMTICVLVLSLALMAISGALLLASKIKGEVMGHLVLVLLAMGVILGILALLTYFGIAEPAILAGIGIGLVMIVLAVSFLITIEVLRLAKGAVKDLPYIKMLIEGIVDIFWDIAGKAALMGVVAPLLIAFAVSVAVVLLVAVLAVLVGKVSRWFTKKDKKALLFVIESMMEVWEMIDDFLAEQTVLSKIPVLGAVAKLWETLGAGLSIIMFSIAIFVLEIAILLTIAVAKISRLVGPKDIEAIKNVVQGMMEVWEMIDDFLAAQTKLSGLPIIGTVAKAWETLGAGLSIIMFAITIVILGAAMTLAIGVMNLARTVDEDDIQATKDVILAMEWMVDEVSGPSIFGAIGNLIDAASTSAFSISMGELLVLMTGYVAVLKMYSKAKDEYGDLTLVGQDLMNNFTSFFKKFDDSIGFWDMVSIGAKSVISTSLIPLMTAISKFVDVIVKVTTMNFLTGYDEKGNPQYEKVPEDCFATAATVVTDGFTYFLTQMKKSFEGDISTLSIDLIEDMGEAIIPMMEAISSFVDAIVKLATAQVPNEWKDGKPTHYLQLDFSEGGDANVAAKAVTNLFIYFMQELVTQSNSLKQLGTNAMKKLGEAMMPMMQGIASFADAIIKLATCQIADMWDKEGKPTHYKKVTGEEMGAAAKVLGDNFGIFIQVLREESDKMQGASKDEAECLAKCMQTIMSAVGDFADAIVKLAGNSILIGYDASGKAKYKEVTATDYQTAATTLMGNFFAFLDILVEDLPSLQTLSETFTKEMTKGMDAVMETIGSFAETILKVASSTYVTGYDAKGNPILKKILPEEFTAAATAVANSFGTFLTTLAEKTQTLSDSDSFKWLITFFGASSSTENLHKFGLNKNEGSSTSTTNNAESLKAIMTAVVDFATVLQAFNSPEMFIIESFDENGKPKYAKDAKGRIMKLDFSDAAKKIADAFATFLTTLATGLANPEIQKNVKTIIENLAGVSEVITPIKTFVEAFKPLTENKDLADNMKGYTEKIVSSIVFLIGGLYQPSTFMKNAFPGLSVPAGFLTNMGKNGILEDIGNAVSQAAKIVETAIPMMENMVKAKADYMPYAAKIASTIDALFWYLENPDIKGKKFTNGFIAWIASANMYRNLTQIDTNTQKILTIAQKFKFFMDVNFVKIIENEKSFAKALEVLFTIKIPEYEKKLIPSIENIIKELTKFDKKILETTKIIKDSSDTVVKAIDAVDNAIINKQKQRTAALKEFATNLNLVTVKLGELKTGIGELLADGNFADYINRLTEALRELAAARAAAADACSGVGGGGAGGYGSDPTIPLYVVPIGAPGGANATSNPTFEIYLKSFNNGFAGTIEPYDGMGTSLVNGSSTVTPSSHVFGGNELGFAKPLSSTTSS